MPLVSFQNVGTEFHMVFTRKILTYYSEKCAENNVTCFIDEFPPYTPVTFSLINDAGICKTHLIMGGLKDVITDKIGSAKFLLPRIPSCHSTERTTLFMIKATWKTDNSVEHST